MKILVVILSIFIISLSAIPCDDDISNSNVESTLISQDSHDDSHNDVDACSPFCTCACCASIVIQKDLIQDDVIVPQLYSELNSSYHFSYTSGYLNRIFQPPQV